MTSEELFSVVIAALSLAVAGLSWRSSRKANTLARGANDRADHANAIAEAALDDARQARLDAVWDEVVRALNNLLTFDFAGSFEDVGPRLVSARNSLQMLADKVDEDALGEWMQAEWVTATLLMREAGEKRVDRRHPDYAGATVQANSAAAAWFAAMINNIRAARLGRMTDDDAESLRQNAVEHATAIRKRNNWLEDNWLRETLQPLQDDRA